MLRRFSHFFAYLLLLLMPLQSIAAANMLVCNSMMQSSNQQAVQDVQAMQKMPCHEGMSHEKMTGGANKQLPEKQQGFCKTVCAALCASANAMTTLPSNPPAATFLVSAQTVSFPQQVYVSITQPNLQRPPILLS